MPRIQVVLTPDQLAQLQQRAQAEHRTLSATARLLLTQALEPTLTKDELDGGWVAEAPLLPGCASQGDTPQEALDNLTDAAAGVLAAKTQECPHPKAARQPKPYGTLCQNCNTLIR